MMKRITSVQENSFAQPSLGGSTSRRRFLAGAAATVSLLACNALSQAPIYGSIVGSVVRPEPRRPGELSDTGRLQRAIDQVRGQGGGTVAVPAGRYVSGTLRLHSHVSLWLDSGATLVMSKDPKEFLPIEKLNYDPKANLATSNFQVALIVGDGVENISIAGGGTIDCDRTKSGGPKPIALRRCSQVILRDITIRNAPSYNISLLGCEFVTLDNVTIRNGLSDGIDPDCSRYVRISNCFVESVDDAIVLKSSGALGERRSTEFITVDNCILRTASIHFKCGTESCGDFRNIVVSNCIFQGGMGMRHGNPGIALYTVDGGSLGNVVISNIVMQDVGTPVAILRGDRDRCAFAAGPGSLQSIQISNVLATGAKLPSVIAGLPGSPVTGIVIDGLSVTMAASVKGTVDLQQIPEEPKDYPQPTMFGPLPAHAIFIRHASAVNLHNLRLQSGVGETLPFLVADDVSDLRLASFQGNGASAPQLWLNNVRQSSVELSSGNFSSTSCRISGPKTAALSFPGIDVTVNRKLVHLDADVHPSAVQSQRN